MNKKHSLVAITTLAILIVLSGCNTGTPGKIIATDSVTIAAGAAIFNQNCSGCHNFRQDGIGPQLSGVTNDTGRQWLMQFIKNSQQVIASGDVRANQLFTAYKKAVMPPFDGFTNEQLNAVIAFIHAQKGPGQQKGKKMEGGLANPYPTPIALSGLVVNIQPVMQFPASSSNPPFARITKLGFQPGTGTLFINDLNGRLYKIIAGKPVVYLDMARLKPKFINQPGLATGLGSFAFHPGFAKNGIFYTSHTEAAGSQKADFGYADI